MKKNLFFGLCAASMLLMTSCDKEAFGGRFGEQETNVTLSVSLPELQTRAYGTGLNAKYLQYTVYSLDAQGALNEVIKQVDNVVMTETAPLSTTIDLKLVPGSKYSIVLWADAYGKGNPNSPFDVSMSTTGNTMTVGVDNNGICKVKTNDDLADAFFGSFEITANSNETSGYVITEYGKTESVGTTLALRRPFAQLNIATTNNDLELAKKSDFEITQTGVKIENVCSTLDLRTGHVPNNKTNGAATTFAMNAIPGTMQTNQNSDYTLLAMAYVLMPADKETVKVTFSYSNGTITKEKPYGNVPLRRNWRTNIYGELFTNDVNIKVEIAPNFADKNGVDDDNTLDPDNNEQYSGNNGNFSAYLP